MELRHVELDALEELASNRVGVLIGIEDVGAVAVEELRKGSDEAFAIGAADEKGCSLFHRRLFSR